MAAGFGTGALLLGSACSRGAAAGSDSRDPMVGAPCDSRVVASGSRLTTASGAAVGNAADSTVGCDVASSAGFGAGSPAGSIADSSADFVAVSSLGSGAAWGLSATGSGPAVSALAVWDSGEEGSAAV